MKEKKVILIAPTPPPFGGVAIFNKELFDILGDEFSVELWSYSESPDLSDSRVKHFSGGALKIFKFLWRAPRRAIFLDSSHFFFEYPNKKILLAFIFFKLIKGWHWVKIFHDGTLPQRYLKFSRLKRSISQWALSFVNQGVVMNESLQEWLSEKDPSLNLVSKTPLLKSLEPNEWGPRPTKESSSYESGYFISVGASSVLYGFDQIARGVESVRSKTGLDIKLILIASTMVEDSEFETELLSGRAWVQFIKDCPQTELYKKLLGSIALIRATENESFGLVRAEALMLGVPVIGTAPSQIKGQLLFQPRDQKALIDHLLSVLRGKSNFDQGQVALTLREEARSNQNFWLKLISEAPS